MTIQEAQEKLKDYSLKGHLPGSFLQAILENNLVGAINKADKESLSNIVPIAQWAWNNLPGSIWGSKDAVQSHIEKSKSKPPSSHKTAETSKSSASTQTQNVPTIEAKGSGGAGCGFGHPEPQIPGPEV